MAVISVNMVGLAQIEHLPAKGAWNGTRLFIFWDIWICSRFSTSTRVASRPNSTSCSILVSHIIRQSNNLQILCLHKLYLVIMIS